MHRYLHTYVGGVTMGLLAGLLMWGIVQVWCRVLPTHSRWGEWIKQTPKQLLLTQSLIAGLIGGVVHILLDSFMHAEMNPFWPFLEGNALAGMLSMRVLHIGLAAMGFFGLMFWLFDRKPS